MEKYEPRSFILNPQKYEPRSLMSDRRSFPITIKKISELKIAFLGPKFPVQIPNNFFKKFSVGDNLIFLEFHKGIRELC